MLWGCCCRSVFSGRVFLLYIPRDNGRSRELLPEQSSQFFGIRIHQHSKRNRLIETTTIAPRILSVLIASGHPRHDVTFRGRCIIGERVHRGKAGQSIARCAVKRVGRVHIGGLIRLHSDRRHGRLAVRVLSRPGRLDVLTVKRLRV